MQKMAFSHTLSLLLFCYFAFCEASSYSNIYISTCYNKTACGSVCGGVTRRDEAAPTEGLFGTSCKCGGDGDLSVLCSQKDIWSGANRNVYACADGNPPSCSTQCGGPICIHMNDQKANATIESACPKYHPVIAQQCCDLGGTYCACIFHDTIVLNNQPFDQLGGQNGYAKVSSGYC